MDMCIYSLKNVDCDNSGLFVLKECVELCCMHLKSLFNRLSYFYLRVCLCVCVCVLGTAREMPASKVF